MALKLVRKKKGMPAAAGRRKKSEIEKFKDAIDVQLRLAAGEKVKKGRGLAKSWMGDGKEYGVERVLVPLAGNRPLYSKSAIVVSMKPKNPPTKELKELRRLAADGKLSKRIYMMLWKQKKSVAAKKRIAKKATAKKPAAKKRIAKKATAKKRAARKSPAKKQTAKRMRKAA